jgi:hypothetical protein
MEGNHPAFLEQLFLLANWFITAGVFLKSGYYGGKSKDFKKGLY